MQNLVDIHRKNIETAGAALAKAVIEATKAHSEAVIASATAFDAAAAEKIEQFCGSGRAEREGNKAIEKAMRNGGNEDEQTNTGTTTMVWEPDDTDDGTGVKRSLP